MFLIRVLLAAGTFLALTSSGFAFELEHQDGKLFLDQTPQRIVSYDLAVLDTLNALGIPVSGVPRSVYPESLDQYNKAPVVGTLFEPDYAALQAVSPELIFAGGRSAPAMPELSKLAPTVALPHDAGDFLASVRLTTRRLGAAWNKTAEADRALASFDDRLDQLHALTHGQTAALLFVIRDNIIVHAPGDRFGYAYELTGLRPVLPAREPELLNLPRPEPGSPEAAAAAARRAADISAVVAAEPDWLIILDRGAINQGEKTAAATLSRHPELSHTRAWREGRVYYADPNRWYVITAGIDNLNTIAQDMQQLIQQRSVNTR